MNYKGLISGLCIVAVLCFVNLWSTSAFPRNNNEVPGPDLDRNGIRDDIDQHIRATFVDQRARAAAEQFAWAFQMALVDASDRKLAQQHALEIYRAIECMGFLKGNGGDDAIDTLRALTVNSLARMQAYQAFTYNIRGMYLRGTVRSEMGKACVYQPAVPASSHSGAVDGMEY